MDQLAAWQLRHRKNAPGGTNPQYWLAVRLTMKPRAGRYYAGGGNPFKVETPGPGVTVSINPCLPEKHLPPYNIRLPHPSTGVDGRGAEKTVDDGGARS